MRYKGVRRMVYITLSPYSRGSCRPFQGGGSHINVSATAADNKAGATGVKYDASFTAPNRLGGVFFGRRNKGWLMAH